MRIMMKNAAIVLSYMLTNIALAGSPQIGYSAGANFTGAFSGGATTRQVLDQFGNGTNEWDVGIYMRQSPASPTIINISNGSDETGKPFRFRSIAVTYDRQGTGTSPNQFEVSIGLLGSYAKFSGNGGITVVDELSPSSVAAYMYIKNLYVIGNVGFVRSNRLDFGRVLGDVLNDIEMKEFVNADQFPQNADIVDLDISGRAGSLLVTRQGAIGLLRIGGRMGDVNSTNNYLEAKTEIRRVVIGYNADYVGNRGFFGSIGSSGGQPPYPDIRRIEIIGSNSSNIAFQGTLKARNFLSASGGVNPGLIITGGDLDADVYIDGGLPSGATLSIPANRNLTPAKFIRLGESAAGTMTFPANGLDGQVIINSKNNGSTWSSGGTVGGTSLSPIPYYNNLSSTLGGGAVGLVPYNLRQAESIAQSRDPADPCQSEIRMRTWPDGTQREAIVLHHYGPVLYQPVSGTPFPYDVFQQTTLCAPTCPPFTPNTQSLAYAIAPFGRTREMWIAGTTPSSETPPRYYLWGNFELQVRACNAG